MNCNIWAIVIILLIIIIIGLIVFSQKHTKQDTLENFYNPILKQSSNYDSVQSSNIIAMNNDIIRIIDKRYDLNVILKKNSK